MKEIGKNYVVSYILGGIAAVLVVGTLILLFKSTTLGTAYIKTEGNPEEILCWFYDCIEAGDFAEAYACLFEYSDLGLDNKRDIDNESAFVMEELKKSYKGNVISDLEIDGLKAKAMVEFTYLDLAMVQKKVEEGISPVLEKYIETMNRSEIYDAGGDYTADFLQKVYSEVLTNVIKTGKDIYVTSSYEVCMQYTKEGWKILTNKDMINCFLGGKVA